MVAAVVWAVTPGGHDTRPVESRSFLSALAPYKVVLTNPQSYLCGFAARLLFLPTTIGDMIWGVPFLREGLGVGYTEAVNRATMVPLGWVIGCPLLGYIADRIGRRKPVLIGGALVMLAAAATIVYLPGPGATLRARLVLGIGSGAAMIPYSIIKEVNPDTVKGSATGAINFLVFTFSALLAPAYGWLLNHLSGGGTRTLGMFQEASVVGMIAIILAIVLACFLRETGSARDAQPGGQPMSDRHHDMSPAVDMTRRQVAGPTRSVHPVYVDHLPPCNQACPAGEDIQGWLSLAQDGKFRQAWERLIRDNPLPAVHGRVCYHPCESACNRGRAGHQPSASTRSSVSWATRPPRRAGPSRTTHRSAASAC